MVLLRTEIFPDKPSLEFNYHKPMMMVGSCFTENMGAKLEEIRYPVDVNPFGIIYNPLSVANSLELLLSQKEFKEDDLFYYNELYNSYFHHGRFSDISVEATLERINSRINYSSDFIRKARYLVITFGTAWVYELKASGQVVSNCHKVPSKEFNRRLLDVDEVASRYHALLDSIKAINPDVRFIMTVSPVRHLKDGAHGNQVSKAKLLLAIDELEKREDVCYFPSYEIMLDDLRDYRFYDEDLSHPNQLAVDYIWEKFQEGFFQKDLIEISEKVRNLMRAMNHRPFHESTQQYQKFLKAHLDKARKLKAEHPEIDMENVIAFFMKKMV